MYGAYAWLTNARTPSRTPERLLLLLGMAGFLIIGMTLPYAFSRRTDGIALGLGYLLVVAVHAGLYVRLNRSILRVVPFNASAAVLVILAGAIGAGAPGDRDRAGLRGTRHGARGGAVVDVLRRRRRRAGRGGVQCRTGGIQAGPRAQRVLLRLRAHAAWHRRAVRRHQGGDAASRPDPALPALPGAGRGDGAVPRRGRAVPARAGHRAAALPRDRGRRLPDRAAGRRDAERGGGDRAARRHRRWCAPA